MNRQDLEQEFRALAIAERSAVAARTAANDKRFFAERALDSASNAGVECPAYVLDLERARVLDAEADGAQAEARAIRARLLAALGDVADPRGVIESRLREMHRALNAEEADAETARREAETSAAWKHRQEIVASRKGGAVRP